MWLRSLASGRSTARLFRQRLAGRARPLPPAPRDMQRLRLTRTIRRPVRALSAARARRRAALRAPLIQPCAAITHGTNRLGEPRCHTRGRDPGAPLMHPRPRPQRPISSRSPDAILPLCRDFSLVGDPGLEPGTSSLSAESAWCFRSFPGADPLAHASRARLLTPPAVVPATCIGARRAAAEEGVAPVRPRASAKSPPIHLLLPFLFLGQRRYFSRPPDPAVCRAFLDGR